MDRIKRLSYEVLDEHKSKFGEDFADNKKVLNQISIIRSKGLKNEIAGYITRFIKKEIREQKFKQEQVLSSQSEEQIEENTSEILEPNTSEDVSDSTLVSEEIPIEVITDTTSEDESSEEKTE